MIYKVVVHFYTANTLSTFILKIIRIKSGTTPTFIVNLLSNTFYVLAVSSLLWKLSQYHSSVILNRMFLLNSILQSMPSVLTQSDAGCGEVSLAVTEGESKVDDNMRMKTVQELLQNEEPSSFTERAWLELFKHYKKREVEAEKDFFHKDMLSDSQVFSTLSVVVRSMLLLNLMIYSALTFVLSIDCLFSHYFRIANRYCA